jgi:hypothetical protein
MLPNVRISTSSPVLNTDVIVYFLVKFLLRIDDALDLAAEHALGGIIGLLFNGLFADKDLIALDGVNTSASGGWINHNWKQLYIQFAYICAAVGYAFVMTALLAKTLDMIPWTRLRTTAEEEALGMDDVQVSCINHVSGSFIKACFMSSSESLSPIMWKYAETTVTGHRHTTAQLLCTTARTTARKQTHPPAPRRLPQETGTVGQILRTQLSVQRGWKPSMKNPQRKPHSVYIQLAELLIAIRHILIVYFVDYCSFLSFVLGFRAFTALCIGVAIECLCA